jgi:hypothetical protein
VIAFAILHPLPWNPIYPSIVSLLLGAVAAALCRPDIANKTWIGALLLVGYYTAFLLCLALTAPEYIERTWNLPALSGLIIGNLPIEELLFAAAFGAYWSSVYDHFTWRQLDR